MSKYDDGFFWPFDKRDAVPPPPCDETPGYDACEEYVGPLEYPKEVVGTYACIASGPGVPDLRHVYAMAVRVLQQSAASGKYGRDDYLKRSEEYHVRAAMRHLFAKSYYDDESGLPHLHHAIARLMLAAAVRHHDTTGE